MPLGNFRYYCYAPLKFGQSLIAQVANCSDVGHRRTAKLNIRFNSPLVASRTRLTDRRLQRPFEHHDRLTSRNSDVQSFTGGLDLKRLVATHTHTRVDRRSRHTEVVSTIPAKAFMSVTAVFLMVLRSMQAASLVIIR